MQTNYTPSKSSRSSSIEQDETTIEVPHLKNEVVSNRKTQTPDNQSRDSNPALTATETGSDVKPDTKVFHSNDVDGDFMSRITKGGKRLFIEEFPQASSPGNYLFFQAAIHLGVSPNFEITVVYDLKFHCYLRNFRRLGPKFCL